MIEADESSIPTSVSTGFNQSNALADGLIEAGSDSNEAEPYYLASINQVYELMFHTFDEDFCAHLSLSLTGSAVTVTEQVARRREPGRISKATSRVDLPLPIGSSTIAVFQSLEPANKPSPYPWKGPKELTEPKHMDGGKSNKARVPDPSTGLDLSKLLVPDADISKLSLTMPSSSTHTTVPLSLLENWDLREHRSIGLSNQLDLMAATALDMVWELSDSIPDGLRALLIHLSRTTQCLSHNAALSMSERLRLRRDLILSSLPNNFLLETGVNSLRTAPLTADSLFGGRIQAALTADCEDQIHASLARSNSGQRPVVFKRPASKPPGPYRPRTLKGTVFLQSVLLLHVSPHIGLLFKTDHLPIESRLLAKIGVRANPIRTRSHLILPSARVDLPKVSPRSNPFLPPQPLMPKVPVGARLMHFASRLLAKITGPFIGHRSPGNNQLTGPVTSPVNIDQSCYDQCRHWSTGHWLL
ncbi:hypothetical protein DPMN_084609 [Dreissena polymorpha]|uniref:Uncharacterized protein n=1 Tax=Dreissena polymorpha TaxID=45954 RepID=A0A9D3YC38_DREPO|nr:hypothetical protein DPMN_084609 [Dreissena polymorpha]